MNVVDSDAGGASMDPCERVRLWVSEGDGCSERDGGEDLSSPSEELRAHARQCGTCGEALAAARREAEQLDRFLGRAVPEWRASVPRIDLTARVLARLAEPETGPELDVVSPGLVSRAASPSRAGVGGRWRTAAIVLVGTAALIAVVLPFVTPQETPPQVAQEPAPSGTGLSAPDHTGTGEPTPTERRATEPLPDPRPDEPFRLSHLLADANTAWSDLARETSATVGDVVALSRPTSSPATVPVAPPGGEPAAEESLLAVPVDWIPLRKQVGGALDFLRDTLREEDSSNSPRAS